jgi:hypothetical protein
MRQKVLLMLQVQLKLLPGTASPGGVMPSVAINIWRALRHSKKPHLSAQTTYVGVTAVSNILTYVSTRYNESASTACSLLRSLISYSKRS